MSGPDYKAIARTNNIFTDQKREGSTVFSSLQYNVTAPVIAGKLPENAVAITFWVFRSIVTSDSGLS